MPVMPETFLTRLAHAASVADKAESDFRESYAVRLAALERDRVLANRRHHFMRTLAAAVEGADDQAGAIGAGARVLAEEIGLDPSNDGHRAVVERFALVSDAVDTLLNCEGEPDHGAVIAELETFEAWYLARTGQPFFALYDVYTPQTPVVDY